MASAEPLTASDLSSILHAISECSTLERPRGATIRKLLDRLRKLDPEDAREYEGLLG